MDMMILKISSQYRRKPDFIPAYMCSAMLPISKNSGAADLATRRGKCRERG
jgi:hypothetical protein